MTDAMQPKQLVKFAPSELQVLRDMVKWWSRNKKKEGSIGDGVGIPDTFQGAILAVVSSVAGIPVATSTTETGRGTIRLRRLWFRGDDTTQEDMDIVGPDDAPVLFNNLGDEFVEHTCYNTSLTQSFEYGETITVLPLKDGHFIAVTGGGAIELYHGVILEQCSESCSTYLVQRVHRYLTADCEGCTGTGTGTGT